MMTGSQRISGEAFAIERLRENPDLDYSSLRRQAESAGVSMQPIQYGRARKQLGLPPLSTRVEPRLAVPASSARAASETDDTAENDDDANDGIDGDDAGAPVAAATDTTDRVATDRGSADRGAADIVAPRRKGSPAFDFLVQELRNEPNIVYGTLRERAEAAGFKIAPIMYGRAKAVLGLVPVKPRGQGLKRGKAAKAPEAPRTLRQVESVAADRFNKELENVRNLEQLVNVVKDLDAERRRLRTLLERIVTMIDETLG
jgi:hypothetical protein